MKAVLQNYAHGERHDQTVASTGPIHTDPKRLYGYCWKEHTRYASLPLFPYAVCGDLLSIEYLKIAYKYYLKGRSSTNEGSEGSLNLLRPGQRQDTATMTRASVPNDVEYFEFEKDLRPLRLSVGKLASLIVAQEHTQLHPMFASGTNSAGADPVLQNIWLHLRKRPRLANGAGVRMVSTTSCCTSKTTTTTMTRALTTRSA